MNHDLKLGIVLGAVGTLAFLAFNGCQHTPPPVAPYRVKAIGWSNSTPGERLTRKGGSYVQWYDAYPLFPILLVEPGMMIAAKHNIAAVPVGHPVIERIPCDKHPDCVEHLILITKGETNPLPDPPVTAKMYRGLLVPISNDLAAQGK